MTAALRLEAGQFDAERHHHADIIAGAVCGRNPA
jgi:hypothetical protein